MSDSDDKVMEWRVHIQAKIDERNPDGAEARFIFEDLFKNEEWKKFTEDLRLARSVTNAFKKRTHGFPAAREPIFRNVEWTGDINVHGRTVNFLRVNGAG